VKRIILIVGGILILAVGFVMWYGVKHPSPERVRKLRPGEQYGVQYREPGEIVVENTDAHHQRAIDKRRGYSVEIPDDWFVEKPDTVTHSFSFYQFERGCKISSEFDRDGFNIEAAIKSAEEDHVYLTVQRYEILKREFQGLPATYVILESQEWGRSDTIYLPIRGGVFSATLFIQGNNPEYCTQEFERMISSLRLIEG
jgi:hypothetical protein